MYIMDVLPILEKLMFVENETVNIASSEMINTEVLAMIICNILDELRKKPHKSSVCGMNCVFFRILFVYF